jgi:hypothetical protein
VTPPLDFRRLWEEATPWQRYLQPEMQRFSLWDGVDRHVRIPEWARDRAAALPARRYLVIAEDWCGDAANTVPVVARLVGLVPGTELRVLPRDDYPEAMDRYLTNGTRSIPIVIGLDPAFVETGHWGPRPSELQTWVLENGAMPKEERYAEVRRWYARDKGETTLREVLEALGPAESGPTGAG